MKGELKNVAFVFSWCYVFAWCGVHGAWSMGHGAWFASHFPCSMPSAPGYFMISFCVFMVYGVYFSL